MQYTLIHVHPQKYWMDTTLVSSYDCVFSSFGLMVYYLCFRNLMKLLILQGFKKWAPINIIFNQIYDKNYEVWSTPHTHSFISIQNKFKHV